MPADLFVLKLVLPLALCLFLSFFIEAVLQPRPQVFWKRPGAALVLHCALLLALFTFEIAVFRRPMFAALVVLVFFFFIVLVSNAKSQSLREPFIFQDFDYFIDAIKHPRLYLPFLGWWRATCASVAFVGAVAAGMMLESPMTAILSGGDFMLIVIVHASVALASLWGANRIRPTVCLAPADDVQRLGLLASLWCYGMEERRTLGEIADRFNGLTPVPRPGKQLPNLVVVQSESFFDARTLFSGIRRDILENFDALKSEASCHGSLHVPAWGANTVRTEFSFLSGMAPEVLGVHRFNPYRRFAKSGISTLAVFLKKQGYRTVCIHPYPAGFYDRDVIFPLLGIDEFIDIKSFPEATGEGPYVDDVSVAKKVEALLDAQVDHSAQPIFIFVITMENHGPLHLEKIRPGDVERLYHAPPPPQCTDLTLYLRHLSNADRMLAMLREKMTSSSYDSWLCFYGDHVPIMSEVYDALGLPGGTTEYLIWHSKNLINRSLPTQEMKAENISLMLLKCMGFTAPSRLLPHPKKQVVCD